MSSAADEIETLNSSTFPTTNQGLVESLDWLPEFTSKTVGGLTTMKVDNLRSYDTHILIGSVPLVDPSDPQGSMNSIIGILPAMCYQVEDNFIQATPYTWTGAYRHNKADYLSKSVHFDKSIEIDALEITRSYSSSETDYSFFRVSIPNQLIVNEFSIQSSDRYYQYGQYHGDRLWYKSGIKLHNIELGAETYNDQSETGKSSLSDPYIRLETENISLRASPYNRWIKGSLFGFFGKLGRSERQPSSYERYASVDFGWGDYLLGNDKLTPETLYSQEWGYKGELSGFKFLVSTALYQVENQILFGQLHYENSDDTYKSRTYKLQAEKGPFKADIRFLQDEDRVDSPNFKASLRWKSEKVIFGYTYVDTMKVVDETSECLDWELRYGKKPIEQRVFIEVPLGNMSLRSEVSTNGTFDLMIKDFF